MSDLYQELWLAQKVSGSKMQTLFQGMTDTAERCRRMRGQILAADLGEKIAGRNRRGVKKTFRECFELLYRESL